MPLYFSCRFITYNKAHFQLRKGINIDINSAVPQSTLNN
ncbi:hypothetical protein F0726_02618 [Acidithiobacillus caldus]|nr:hypothetical protein F0726_02618 [Acidithiobacillus caldus]